jgi:hypothetical protein
MMSVVVHHINAAHGPLVFEAAADTRERFDGIDCFPGESHGVQCRDGAMALRALCRPHADAAGYTSLHRVRGSSIIRPVENLQSACS